MPGRSNNFKAKSMLSKIELEFLKSPESFSADYSRVLRHRIKAKTAQLHSELALLEGSGLSVTENCNGVTEFCNGQQNKQGLNHVAFKEILAGPTGIEPATPGLKVRCSSLTELRTPLKSLRTDRKMRRGFLAFRLE